MPDHGEPSPPSTAPARCRARVLAPAPADLAAELLRMGASPAQAAAAESWARLRVVKVAGPPPEAAAALSRHMRDSGGEAVVGHGQCLLVGSRAVYDRMLERLALQGLAEAARAIAQALEAFDRPAAGELRCGGKRLPVGERTLVMGIVNATPDSFSGDGRAGEVGAMVALGEEMAAQGADLLDVGGESTRPGSEPVAAQEEMARVVPVIEGLAQRVAVPVSVDTYKARVARAALDAGAGMINDISALRADPGMAALAAERGAAVVVMHMQGTPRTMQQAPHYQDLMGEITAFLAEAVERAAAGGVAREQVVVDPGFGFGKTPDHNLEIVRRLRELKSLGQPLLLGPSRKSSIGKVLGDLPAHERLEGTLAVLALAVWNGADLVRVHDVAAALRAVRMAEAVMRGWRE